MKESLTPEKQFIEAFWDKFDFVSGQLDSNRSELKEFMWMIEGRSKLEQKYSEGLIQLYTPKYDNRASLVGQLIRTYLNELRKRAEQAKIFSNFLTTQVAYKIRDLVDGTNNDFKKFVSTGKAADKELDRLKQLVSKNRARHQKKEKQLAEVRLIEFTSTSINPQKKDQQREKIAEKKLDLKQITSQLNKNIEEYNSFTKSYQETMNNVMRKFYEFQHSRIKTVLDSVLKVLLTELASFKSIVCQIGEVSRYMNDIDAIKELSSIAQNNLGKQTGRSENAIPQPELNFLSSTFERIASKELERVLQYGKVHKQIIEKCFKQEQITQDDDQTKKVIIIASIFKRAWSGQSTEVDLKDLTTLMDNVFLRKDFVLCLQQLRILGKFEISLNCLDHIVKAVNVVLDSCLFHKDGYTGKQIMVLVFTYFVMLRRSPEATLINSSGQQPIVSFEKVFLQQYVKSHSLWSQTDFWQSSFIESVYEQCRQYLKSNPEKQLSLEYQQNLVFNQLAYYVHNMILFSISEKEVRFFATRFIKLYNLDEARTSYIYNNIEHTLKEQKISSPKITQKKAEPEGQKETKALIKQDSQQEQSSSSSKPPSKIMSSIKKMFQ